MSTASKITLAASIVVSTVTVIWVHKVQREEQEVWSVEHCVCHVGTNKRY